VNTSLRRGVPQIAKLIKATQQRFAFSIEWFPMKRDWIQFPCLHSRHQIHTTEYPWRRLRMPREPLWMVGWTIQRTSDKSQRGAMCLHIRPEDRVLGSREKSDSWWTSCGDSRLRPISNFWAETDKDPR
jgi:hypothetical protein